MDTRKKIKIFFILAQNIPFGKLLREKIVLVSSNLFYGRNFEKFEKCILAPAEVDNAEFEKRFNRCS